MKFALVTTVVLAGCVSKPEASAKDSTEPEAPPASTISRPPEDLAAIVGRLVHKDGSPAAGAQVSLVSDTIEFLARTLTHPALGASRCVPSAPLLRAAADGKGSFRVEGLDPLLGWFLDIDLGAGAHEIVRVDLSLSAGGTTDLGLVELPDRRLRPGRLLDDRRLPVGGARIRLASEFAEMQLSGADGTDPDVALLFRSPNGEFYVWTAPAWLIPVFARQPLLLAEGGTHTFSTDPSGAFEACLDREDPLALRVWIPGAPDPVRGSDSKFIQQTHDEVDLVLPHLDDVEVRVLDADGKPVGCAEVRIASLPLTGRDEEPEESAGPNPLVLSHPIATDLDGRAVLRAVHDGKTWIAVRSPGLASWTIREWDSRGGRTAEVRVPRPCSAVVCLKDASSRAVSGELRVFARCPGLGPCSDLLEGLPYLASPAIRSPVTRIGSGEYRLEGLGPGEYTVYALSDGERIGSADLSLDGTKEADVSIALERARPIRMRVVSQEAGSTKAVAGALVSWLSEDEGQGIPASLDAAFTDGDGVVHIPDAGRASLNFSVRHPRFAPVDGVLDSDAKPDKTVEMSPGGSIEGRIHRSGRDPGQVMRVEVGRRREGEEPPRLDDMVWVATDEHGRFRVDRLAAGEYSISTVPASSSRRSAGGLEPSSQTAEASAVVDPGKRTTLDVDLSTGGKPLRPGEGRLHGTVFRDSKPWPGAIVLVSGDAERRDFVPERILTDAQGEFGIGPVGTGAYRVSIQIEGRDGGYETLAERSVEFTAGEEPVGDFDLHFGRALAGVVQSAADGKGIDGARLTLWPNRRSSDGSAVSLGLHWAKSDARGAFKFPELPVGEYVLLAECKDLVRACANLTIAVETPGELPPIVLSPGALVQGQAVFETPSGFKRPHVRFFQLTDRDPRKSRFDPCAVECSVDLDAQTNSFRTRALAPGIYRVSLGLETRENLRFESNVIEIPPEGLKDLRLEFEREKSK